MTGGDESPPSPDELSVGDTGPTMVVEDVGRPDFVRYAGASGDFNPIHYDDQYAREAGYPSVFGQGMFTAGVAARAATDWLGVESIEWYRVRFRSKFWPGDTLVAVCEVTDLDPIDDGCRVELSLRAENQDDDLVLSGDLTVKLVE